MSNDRDMVLQNLFNEADERLDDVAFTSQVVKRTYKLLIRLGLLAACMALVVLAGMVAWATTIDVDRDKRLSTPSEIERPSNIEEMQRVAASHTHDQLGAIFRGGREG